MKEEIPPTLPTGTYPIKHSSVPMETGVFPISPNPSSPFVEVDEEAISIDEMAPDTIRYGSIDE